MDQGQTNKYATLDRIAVRVRMELARIIDPRHDRDAEMVMAEVAAIWDVLHHALEEIVAVEKNFLDTNAAAAIYSATAAPEDVNDAEHEDTPLNRDSTPANRRKRKATKAQVPLP